MEEEFFIKGKRLADCTDREIFNEWQAGMFLESQDTLSERSYRRLLAIEQEYFKRDIQLEDEE